MNDGVPDVREELIKAGAEGHLVLLVGAGASMDAGLPGWSQLLESLFERAMEHVTDEAKKRELESARADPKLDGDPLLKATLLEDVVGSWWREAVVQVLDEKQPEPTETDHALAALEACCCITTNYDRLLEQALQQRLGKRPQVVTPDDTQALANLQLHAVLKLHGDIDRPDTIVLTQPDYDRLLHDPPQAWKDRVKAFLQPPYQMLLVGYGYGDIDLQLAVGALRAAYQGQLPGPFWLEARSRVSEIQAKAHGLRLVDVGADYSNVLPFLRELARQIEERKQRHPRFVMAKAYAGEALAGFEKDHEAARQAFAEQRFAEAHERYAEMLGRAERLSKADPESRELASWVARCRLNVAACLLCLQELEQAKPYLDSVDPETIKDVPRSLATLAEGLAQTGDIERALDALRLADTPSPEIEAAWQLVDILKGKHPDSPIHEPWVRAKRAWLLHREGMLDQAAREALAVLEQSEDRVLTSSEALEVLFHSLTRSVRDFPFPRQVISDETRPRVVTAIEVGLARLLEAGHLPEPVKEQVEEWQALFYQLTWDEEGIARTKQKLEAEGKPLFYIDPEMERPLELIRAGRVEEALAALPRIDHPWWLEIRRAGLLVMARKPDAALDVLNPLVAKWPGVADVEFNLADVLYRLGRANEAVPHARRALTSVPGRGARLLLARCLIGAGAGDDAVREAWDLLEPLAKSDWPQTLRARGWAAGYLNLREAPAIWKRYLSLPEREGESEAWLQLATSYQRLGEPGRAADAGWTAFEKGRSSFNLRQLATCAQLQQLQDQPEDRTRRRVRQIALQIRDRFPGDWEAEQVYLQLYTWLGMPADLPPVDYPGLAEAGFLRAVSSDELVQLLREANEQGATAEDLYRHGALTTDSFCRMTNVPPSHLLTRVIKRQGAFLSVPVSAGVRAPALAGAELLAGELELLILQELDLLDRLCRQLKPGRIVVFRDVVQQIKEHAARLTLFSREAALGREQRLLQLLLRRHDRVHLEPPRTGRSERDVAMEEALPFAIDEDPGAELDWIAPAALVRCLAAEGLLEREHVEPLLTALPGEDAQLDHVPARMVISWPVLARLFHLDALGPLIDAVECLWVGSDAHRFLLDQIAEHEEQVESARRAVRLDTWLSKAIASGLAHEEERPRPQGVPQLRDANSPPLVPKLVEEILSWREAQGVGKRWLLTADSLTSALFTVASPLALMQALAWTKQSYGKMAARVREVAPREVHLPELVRQLRPAGSDAEAQSLLAQIGFQDAIGAGELRSLARRYGVGKGRPKKVLDGVERIAANSAHPGAPIARMNIARTYAEAIWIAWTDREGSEQQARDLARDLLDRVQNLDALSGGVLDYLLVVLTGHAMDYLGASYAPDTVEQDSDLLTLSNQTPAGKLWSYLHDWAGAHPRRRPSLNRALLHAACFLDERSEPGDPPLVTLGPLLLAITPTDTFRSLDPAIHGLLILSGNWTTRPLAGLRFTLKGRLGKGEREVTLEDACEVVLDLVRRDQPGVANVAGTWHVSVPVSNDDYGIVPLPPEAVVLRARDGLPRICHAAIADLGPSDGTLALLIEELARNPANDPLRHRLARAAARAPFRLIRDDPAWLACWGDPGRIPSAGPHMLGDLRAILSEPGPVPEEDIRQVLISRVEHEKGPWAQRSDLARQSSEVLGALPTVAIRSRLDSDDHDQEVAQALAHLEDSRDTPAARIIGDMAFLRAAAEQRPLVQLPTGQEDLRDVLPRLFERVLEQQSSSRQSSDKTLAEMEAGLLRMCRQAVFNLALGQAPARDMLWLTWRLYQWLEAQLSAIPASIRSSHLGSLEKLAPLSVSPELCIPTPLDPNAYAPDRYDHRLAAVLVGLHQAEAVTYALADDKRTTRELRRVFSSRIGKVLAKLASRSISDEEKRMGSTVFLPLTRSLGWDGPCPIAEIALSVMLPMDASSFLRLAPEVRVRWLAALGPPCSLAYQTIGGLLGVVANHGHQLSEAERAGLADAIRALADQDQQYHGMVLLALTGLLAAGEADVEPGILRSLDQQFDDPELATKLAHYFVALSRAAPQRVEETAQRYIERLGEGEGEPLEVLRALAGVVFSGDVETIPILRDILHRIAGKPPFDQDPRVKEITSLLDLGDT
jgi:tetratricopeptide (TPR) repeat protein